MVTRETFERAFAAAVRACDPAVRVRDALRREPVRGAQILGLAVGKAALAMARGAGKVERGLAVAPADDGKGLPEGWTLMLSDHPMPTDRSVAAGVAAIALVGSAEPEDHVLALLSGGASSLIEVPTMDLGWYRVELEDAMRAGLPIAELNALRTSMSTIKGGKLAQRCRAPLTTLIASDVIGDDPHVIGSGPTIRDEIGDRVEVVAPMASFGEAFARALGARRIETPVEEEVTVVAERLAREADLVVAWGEPTVRRSGSSMAGVGGRAQHLALLLARHLRGSERSAFVAGTDGIDGWRSDGQPVPAGAFVDGSTWDALVAAGVDPDAAIARCDAGTALGSVGALVITGPTGINHADVIAIG